MSWFSGVAPATRTIIVINLAIWLLQVVGTNLRLEELFALRSDDVLGGYQVWRLLTATFLHSPSNVLHILWNLLFLYWIGREMESMQGTRQFTCFYLASAVVSSLGWALVDHRVPGGRTGQMVGASGAITALAVVFTLFYPNREVLLFFLPMRMWMLLAIYLGGDVLGLLRTISVGHAGPGSQIAFASHLTGAAFGYLYKTSGIRLSRMFSVPRSGPRLRVVVPERREPTASRAGGRADQARPARPVGATPVTEELLEARLDEVLAKIAREGRAALTDEEKSILEEASRRARLRRSDRL
jgi:membrane associated rhomboid family serine protease